MVQLSLRDCIPFLIMGVQCFIFFNVESIEMKLALVAVFGFQIWQKSRTKKEEESDADDVPAPQKRKIKKKE